MKRYSIPLLLGLAAISANAVAVTLNANDGTGATQTVTSGALPTPTRTGYHFVGWFPDETTSRSDYFAAEARTAYVPGTLLCGTPVANASDVSADTTLYAKWVPQAMYDHFHGRKLVVLGDSISTYAGADYRPNERQIYQRNESVFYPYTEEGTHILRPLAVNQHWWGQILQALDMEFQTINAIGGSAVLTNYKAMDNTLNQAIPPRGMLTYSRIDDLAAHGTPEVIIIAAGVNDCILFDIDSFDPDADYLTNELEKRDWTTRSFAEGYALMIRRIQDQYPDAEIITFTPFSLVADVDGLSGKVERANETILGTCGLLGVASIDMRQAWSTNDTTGIHYQAENVHPYIAGLTAIANCFFENWKAPCLHTNRTTTPGTPATCTTPGTSDTVVCNDCHTTIASSHSIPALGHAWDAGTITTQATESQPGVRTFHCTRTGCTATKTEPVPYAVGVVAMRNVAAATAVGSAPTLPSTVVGLHADGTTGASFPVVWGSADYSAPGIVEVAGTANSMPVKAYVRVVSAAAGSPIDLRAQAYEKDVYLPNGSRLLDTWTKYFSVSDWRDVTAAEAAAYIFDGDDETYFRDDLQANHYIGLKWHDNVIVTEAALRTDQNCYPTTKDINLETADRTILDSKRGSFYDGSIPGHRIVFQPATQVPTKEVRIVIPDVWDGCFIAREVTVTGYFAPGDPTPTANAALTGISVDGTPVPNFQASAFYYDQEGETVTPTFDGNVAITILPAASGTVRIVTLAEDGTATSTYAIHTGSCGHEHTTVTGTATDPTCTTPGHVPQIFCTDCNKEIQAAADLPALGHDWNAAWTVTTQPTCLVPGAQSKTCGRAGCGAVTNEVIAALGHDYHGTVTTPATQSSAGVMTYTCSHCSDTYTETIPPLPTSAYVDISVAEGYVGGEVSDGFAMLVKLDATKVPGIYSAVQSPATNLKFTDSTGAGDYPYEVDTWDNTGTSLIWVRLPSFSASTEFRMYFGADDIEHEWSAGDAWVGYDLVCHVNGTADDSSPNHHEGVLNTATGMRSTAGKLGLAYGTANSGVGPVMKCHLYPDSTPAGALADTEFSVSFWIRFNATPIVWNSIVGPKTGNNSNAWGLNVYGEDCAAVLQVSSWGGGNNISFSTPGLFPLGTWVKVDATWKGNAVALYVNGVCVGSKNDMAIVPWVSLPWVAWGGYLGWEISGYAFVDDSAQGADFDECRVYGGEASAARVAADYFVVNSDACVFGEVHGGELPTPVGPNGFLLF